MVCPKIIQGGMGVAVSSWPLARAVSIQGQLGVVSGTGLDTVMVRRLQLGDVGGHIREALSHFPNPSVSHAILSRYFIEGGKSRTAAFRSKPLPALHPTNFANELAVAANFVEVFLAKRGHDGLVGINLLEKIRIGTLPALFGAMLAGVDFVLMGAGIPRAIPGVLDRFAEMKPADLEIGVVGASNEKYETSFNPKSLDLSTTELKRPNFLPIISSAVLALTMAKKASGSVEGFVIEAPSAGGHNAPPRGNYELNDRGEPIYGPRDDPNLDQIREIGLPFWMAGAYGRPEGLQKALSLGAAGIQVGTAFAFCEESGIEPQIKQEVIERSRRGDLDTFTDPAASPTGFPFKVLKMEETLSEEDVYEDRDRICDLGYLREAYLTEKGTVGFRCPGEPVADFIKKGGEEVQTEGRKCICNGLMATVGLGQMRKGGYREPPIITAGEEVRHVAQFLPKGKSSYTAKDVLDRLLNGYSKV